jgi:hypothetical protein
MDNGLPNLVGVDFKDAGVLLIYPYDCVLHDDLLEPSSTDAF